MASNTENVSIWWCHHVTQCRDSSQQYLLVVTPCLLTRIYPHAASQYHSWPKATHDIAMLCVDKFPYLHQQTRGIEFILCSNDTCHTWKCFHSFRNQISLLSGQNYGINTVLLGHIAAARKVDGSCYRHCEAISGISFSLYLMLMMSKMRYMCLYFTVFSQSDERVSTKLGMNYLISCMAWWTCKLMP